MSRHEKNMKKERKKERNVTVKEESWKNLNLKRKTTYAGYRKI
jgi:hypothetical protein